MMPSCRTLLLATIGIILLSPFPSDKALSEPQDKSQETPQTQPQPETQPAVPKLSTEPKPQSAPPVKPEAPAKPPTEPKPQPQTTPPVKPEPPKLSTEPKPQPQVQTAPSTKPEPPPEHETKEKEKEVHKKPLGSLILTVKLALLADARLFRYEIEVGEDEQTVTLIGRVSSEEDKTVAAEVARSVPGVKSVVNKLEVDKGLAQGLVKKQDEIITGLVKDRFAKSATLKSANFEVKTEEGVVSISGAVRFQVIALEAAEAARQVPGVKAVKTDKVRLEGES
jgi:hyperosmotically inducible protein